MNPTDNTPVGASSDSALGVPSFPPVETTASEDAPTGVKEVFTPSGIGIYYQPNGSGQKRLYRVIDGNMGIGEAEWEQVPSMSDILNIYDKPGLPWWGMRMGIEGVMHLVQDGVIQKHQLVLDGVDDIIDLLTKHRLTVNHVRDKAGDRGTNVHTALETWDEYTIMPNPELFNPEEQGYVKAVLGFLIESQCSAVMAEVMVASLAMGFAGRFDNIVVFPEDVEMYIHRTDAGKGDKTAVIPAGRYMIDCKTSKGVYEIHHLQLAGYRLALEESYGELVDGAYVLHARADGRYALVECKATAADFVAARKMYDVMKRLK